MGLKHIFLCKKEPKCKILTYNFLRVVPPDSCGGRGHPSRTFSVPAHAFWSPIFSTLDRQCIVVWWKLNNSPDQNAKLLPLTDWNVIFRCLVNFFVAELESILSNLSSRKNRFSRVCAPSTRVHNRLHRVYAALAASLPIQHTAVV